MKPRVIFLDTETTGLSPSYARIIEIAAVEVDDNFTPIRVFHEYLDPKQRVGGSFRIHGLSDDFLRGRKTFRDIAASFIEFIRESTVYAHNMPFDQGFLNAELSRCGFPRLETFADPVDTLPWGRSKVCGSAKLDALLQKFNIDASARSTYHGALIDAGLLLQVFLCLGGNQTRAQELDFQQINEADAVYQQTCLPTRLVEPEPDFDDDYDDDSQEDAEPPRQASGSSGAVSVSCYDEYREKLEAIVDFADSHPFFDGDMYEDMLEKYLETGHLSPAQELAVDNVCAGFHIW